MEGEVNNFIALWITVAVSLCYCHTIGKLIPPGISRFLATLPVIFLFFSIPLALHSLFLVGITSFMVAWLANFNLLLFAFARGPLSSNPPLSLFTFIPMACLPIKIINIQPSTTSQQKPLQNKKLLLNLGTKLLFSLLLIPLYGCCNKESIMWVFYCLNFYLAVETFLGLFAFLTRAMAKVDVEPQFNKSYLATSLQDFWSRRWNLMVSGVLHSTIYEPVYFLSKGIITTRNWASIPAILATFLVSGLMHELIFFYMGRVRPNGHVTFFFLMQGISLVLELIIKKKTAFLNENNNKYNMNSLLPKILSRVLALGFVVGTSCLLFFPPLLRGKPHLKICSESLAFMEFITRRRLVSPRNISCPIF